MGVQSEGVEVMRIECLGTARQPTQCYWLWKLIAWGVPTYSLLIARVSAIRENENMYLEMHLNAISFCTIYAM